jgi:WD40 repeat protein
MHIRPSRLGTTSLLLGLTVLCHVSLFWPATMPTASGQVTTQKPKSVVVDEKAIRDLIAQLGDDSFAKRDEAQSKLIALGKSALASLRKAATESMDAEVRQRAAKAVKMIAGTPGPGFWFPGANVFDIAFSKDGQNIAVGCADGVIRIYDARTSALQQALKGHTATVYSVVYCPDAKTLVSCAGSWLAFFNESAKPGEIIIWDLAKGSAEGIIKGPTGSLSSVTLSPNGKKLFATGGDGKIRMWDLATRTEIKVVSGHETPVRRILFTPDGKLLASAGMDGSVRFWNPVTLEEVRRIDAHADGVGTLTFSPDGKYMVTVNRANAPPVPGEIKVWDMATNKQKATFTGHTGKVLSLAVSPDNTLLAVGGGSNQLFGEVLLFDLATGATRASFPDHKEWVECVTFSADGNWLASGGGYTPGARGEIRLWDVKRRVAKGEQTEMSPTG